MQQIQKNILLAEDDRASGNLLKDLLKKSDYTVDWFQDGNEALANYRPNHHSLILTDIEMPGILVVSKVELPLNS